MICKTPEEVLAYDQGVLDERERIISLLGQHGPNHYAVVEYINDERIPSDAAIWDDRLRDIIEGSRRREPVETEESETE